MKRILLLLIVLLGFFAQAQFGLPTTATKSYVKWTTSVNKVSATEYQLIINGTIEKGRYLYSQYLPENSAFPTSIIFEKAGKDFKLKGKTKEVGAVVKMDPIFEVEINYFKGKAQFIQNIEIVNPATRTVEVLLEYQTCDDTSCVMDSDDLTFQINDSLVTETSLITDSETEQVVEKIEDTTSIQIAKTLKLNIKQNNLTNEANVQLAKSSHWDLFFLGFLGGLLALLTPCVFPMIPLTVSFFTKQSSDRKNGIMNAILYGIFIVTIYVLLSVPFHFLDSLDPEILNNVSTNVWLNVFFFVIFLFFAFSFFGYYELTLPSSWGNKMDSASSIGGLIGIFFMAVTLSIVSFSCTGPILGSLLAGSLTADGGAMQLTMGMAGFGFALALPFALFALFPSMLSALPKSGGWLTTTKVVLGFLELALALKFLSNADLVSHWGFLKRELFIGIWIVLFTGLTLYLFGKIRFPHDAPIIKLSLTRKTLASLSFLFVLYLLPGVTNTPYANLKVLSGFPPPLFYSYYEHTTELHTFNDFESGLAYAKKHDKPILLDFTGWACVNCRKMEENVWTVPQISKLLKDDYVLISLYVDDRKELPKQDQFEFKKPNGKTKKIKTIGDKWATFQAVNFNTASQPYYVLLSPNLEILNKPSGTATANEYYEWLKEGKETFENLKSNSISTSD